MHLGLHEFFLETKILFTLVLNAIFSIKRIGPLCPELLRLQDPGALFRLLRRYSSGQVFLNCEGQCHFCLLCVRSSSILNCKFVTLLKVQTPALGVGKEDKEGRALSGISHMILLIRFSVSTRFVKTPYSYQPSQFFAALVNVKMQWWLRTNGDLNKQQSFSHENGLKFS